MLKPETLIPEKYKDVAEGVETWGEYVQNLADDNDVDFNAAWSLFELLGETEAFDGFVTSIEDMGGF